MRPKGFPLGLAVGVILAFALVASIDPRLGPIFSEKIVEFTAIGATLLAAAIAYIGIQRQIQSSFSIEQRIRAAKLDAAISVLPLVLSGIHQVCTERCDALCQGRKDPRPEEKWVISSDDASTLKECIEYADSEEKDALKRIIRIYQVLTARWRDTEVIDLFSMPETEDADTELVEYYKYYSLIEDWVDLQALVGALFDFSRGKTGKFSLANAKLLGTYRLSYITDRGLDALEGYHLSNRNSYSRFLAARRAGSHVSILDDVYWAQGE